MAYEESDNPAESRPLGEIRIRDPFVLVERDESRYWLYGTTDPDPWQGPGVGFDAWWSRDLENWHGPVAVFRPPGGFWAEKNFWAPEVHRHRGRLIMIASFRSARDGRGVQTLVADHPAGPFLPHSVSPVTPPGWECLDGTLYIEDDAAPWLVFCHEWLQIDDGRICAMPMTPNLDGAAGDPVELFRASAAPWVRPVQEKHHFVTDGPFLHRAADGDLLMLWSSFGRGGYAVGLARSATGALQGPWRHEPRPLRQGDGGHAMLFRDLDRRLVMAIHTPNRTPMERARLLQVEESVGGLRLVSRPWWFRWRQRLRTW
jgi:hypothetical protein